LLPYFRLRFRVSLGAPFVAAAVTLTARHGGADMIDPLEAALGRVEAALRGVEAALKAEARCQAETFDGIEARRCTRPASQDRGGHRVCRQHAKLALVRFAV
jgi:hypothetical protein